MSTIPEPDGEALRFLEASASSLNQPVKTGEVLLRKMRTFITRMDMDGDGYLTKRDLELLAGRYADYANMRPDKAKQVLQQLQVTWDNLYAPEADQNQGRLSPEKMTEGLIRRGRDMVVAMAAICFSARPIYDIMDVEKKGYVTLENFRAFHILLNVKDKKDTRKTFESVDENGDGQISFMEYQQAGIDFFISNDKDSPYNILFGPLVD